MFALLTRPTALASLFFSLLVLSGGPSLAEETAEPEATAASDEALDEARLHFSNGVELLQADPPNYQDAYRQFALAYAKSGRSWKVAGNLGLCALKLERDGEALALYEQYLREGGSEVDESERRAIERELLLVRGNMTTVELSSPLEKTTVKVTRKGSSVPAQIYELEPGGSTLGLRSGELTLTAEADGKTEVWTVIAGPEERRTHAFSFAPAQAPAPSAPVPSSDSKSGSGLRTTGYIVGGVGLAALVGGVVSGVLAKDAEGKASDRCIGTVCPEDAEGDFQSASDTATLANVLLISGGVLTATGVTFVILGSTKSSPEAARIELTPRLGAGSYGLFAHGHF